MPQIGERYQNPKNRLRECLIDRIQVSGTGQINARTPDVTVGQLRPPGDRAESVETECPEKLDLEVGHDGHRKDRTQSSVGDSLPAQLIQFLIEAEIEPEGGMGKRQELNEVIDQFGVANYRHDLGSKRLLVGPGSVQIGTKRHNCAGFDANPTAFTDHDFSPVPFTTAAIARMTFATRPADSRHFLPGPP